MVDVNLNVWGDAWDVSLPSLRATLRLPKASTSSLYRVWAGPAWVRGVVDRTPAAAILQATSVPSHQLVDLRVLFPRTLLSSTAGAKVQSGAALTRIVGEEKKSYAAWDSDRRRLSKYEHSPNTWLALLLLAFAPGLAVIGLVYTCFGREPKIEYDRRYEQEPPSDLAPALVPALVSEGSGAGANEFTATLFDLIRRGRYKAEHVTTEQSSWGGLHKETVSDLQLTQGKALDSPTPWEKTVTDIVDPIIGENGERLSRFHDRIAEQREENAKRFQEFTNSVKNDIGKRGWYSNLGLNVLLVASLALLLAGAIPFFYGVHRFRVNAPRFDDVVAIALGVCALISGVITAVAATRVPLWRSRKKPAQLEAARWTAFRRYLNDFPRLEEAPPVSIALWESYLVYGIAFGIADRVLKAAQIHMPQELHDQSSLYWISANGDLGSGASALAISDLSSGLSSALAPPSSSGSGGGGGFGGGGFGGGGGGGGGGW